MTETTRTYATEIDRLEAYRKEFLETRKYSLMLETKAGLLSQVRALNTWEADQVKSSDPKAKAATVLARHLWKQTPEAKELDRLTDMAMAEKKIRERIQSADKRLQHAKDALDEFIAKHPYDGAGVIIYAADYATAVSTRQIDHSLANVANGGKQPDGLVGALRWVRDYTVNELLTAHRVKVMSRSTSLASNLNADLERKAQTEFVAWAHAVLGLIED